MDIFRFGVQEIDKYRDDMIDLLNQSLKLSFKKNIPYEYLEQRMNVAKEYIKDNKAIIFGLIEEGILLGFIWCFEKNMIDEKMLHVVHFVVEEKQRNNGIGSMLIKKIEEYANEVNINLIELLVTKDNSKSVEFYHNKEFFIERYTMLKRLD
ncbi:GNAT family N-acetyltransferase [Romboutsia ilealis]|uniref:GNAT family N-acetyltransferase n=1 Tax=Romboutsia faecis TaxID=2764597 RepID=A0ABR7JLM5_9FIRM|nr:GNAT family N-acetyltransferase [Romboutsia faecis]MBC5995805.1 GNAT family N-acetyltransferase [Romboutsia faecis]MRN23004.1 GNAT family N-acetyltransferase [Romboutsia ilealis]